MRTPFHGSGFSLELGIACNAFWYAVSAARFFSELSVLVATCWADLLPFPDALESVLPVSIATTMTDMKALICNCPDYL